MAEIPQQTQDADVDLRIYLDILLRRRWVILAVTAVILTQRAFITFTSVPIYRAQTLLLIEKERGSTKMGDAANVENTQDDYYQTQYRLLKSDSLMLKVYDSLALGKTEEFGGAGGVGKLNAAVSIAPILHSRLLHVVAESADNKLAPRIADAVADAFVRENLQNQLFISKEILEALEVDSHTPQGRRLQEGLPAVVNNPLIQQLKVDLARLQAQAADMGRRYKEKHPALSALNSNIVALEAQLRAETDRVVAGLKTELSGQLKGNNMRIVDRAVLPTAPVRPQKARSMLIGLMLGLVAGYAVAFLLEVLDQTLRSQEDVEQRLGQPFLGLIPFLLTPKGTSPYHSLISPEASLSSEAFRNLRTMVDFADVAERNRSFLVTSTVQEEGKTYVATNLAVTFALLGERVLIIDGDLRRPQIHRNFRLSTQRGISDFLAAGKNVEELEALVQKTEVPNLSALVCGTRPPNPSELLNTPRLTALLAWAREHYDRVMIDCTPMFPIHDTLLWGRHVRAGVFVVKYAKTRVPLVQNALQRVSGGGIKLLGVAVNAAKPGGLTYAHYGYYYQSYYHAYQEEPARTPQS